MGNFDPSNSRNAHVAISIIEPSIKQTAPLLLFIHVPLHSFAVTRKILQRLASPPPQANICSIHIKRHRTNVLFFHEEKSLKTENRPNKRKRKTVCFYFLSYFLTFFPVFSNSLTHLLNQSLIYSFLQSLTPVFNKQLSIHTELIKIALKRILYNSLRTFVSSHSHWCTFSTEKHSYISASLIPRPTHRVSHRTPPVLKNQFLPSFSSVRRSRSIDRGNVETSRPTAHQA